MTLKNPQPSDHKTFWAYIFWVFGFIGLHRFFLGRPLTGTLWALTMGLLLIGWLVDLFLIPAMVDEANERFPARDVDYNLTWILLILVGALGIHRFYQGKVLSGLLYLLTLGVFGVGIVYDIFTLNRQIAERDNLSL